MTEASDEQPPDQSTDPPDGDTASDGDATPEGDSVESLRQQVEEKYDFENFGPRDMREMSAEEWDVAFDSETWITGGELLDRVWADLRAQVADREVFAVVENVHEDGQRRVLAYSDEGYAVVYPDGGVAGFGTVLRDVKPTVALCSLDEYEPDDPPEDDQLLPPPEGVPVGSGGLGHLMMQVIAATLVLSGVVLLGAWIWQGLPVIVPAVGLFFLVGGLILLAMVANARLSDRFRAAEYRERLRTVGVNSGEYPEFVPVEDGRIVDPGEPPAAADGDDQEA